MKLKLCDFLTLLNAACGMIAIMLVMSNRLNFAPYFMLAAVLFDFLDGRVARLMKTDSKLGKQLDSLSDIISFGVAPVVFGYSQIQTSFAVIGFTALLICGVLRLARFNVQTTKGVYYGMPIPWGTVIVCTAYFLSLPVKFYPHMYLLLAALMISSFKIKKAI
jgi:CDP-diacylglycerol--serine O-phosphatidyltransferase